MNKLTYLIIAGISLFGWTQNGWSQNIQSFGPSVHKDLDHRISTRSICVPSPKTDLSYNFNISFAENVNNAIKKERSAFSQSKIGDYVHPAYYEDPVDYVHKIMTALRQAYAEAYDIQIVDVPLDTAVINAAQNHSCKMISCNQFTHQSSCTGSPKSRLSAQVGAWGSCLHGYSENIAINTAHTIEGAIEWAIFGMMYDDLACCRNGHRENFLKCTYDNKWRMGFGFKKGKYSFGGGRSYDTWFMTWDYAKIGRTSGCTWNQDKGTKNCQGNQSNEFQAFQLTGQNDCNKLKATWTMAETYKLSDFEVFLRQDDMEFTQVEKISFDQKNKNYTATFPVKGEKAEVYIKANTSHGSFVATPLRAFDLKDCSVTIPPEKPKPDEAKPVDPEPDDEVTENNPPREEPEKEDSDDIVVVPNPAKNEIELKNVPYGSSFRIYALNGRPVMNGIYTKKIRINRLRAGTYAIVVNGEAIQFVKL